MSNKTRLRFGAVLLSTLALGGLAVAQQGHSGHGAMPAKPQDTKAGETKAGETPATTAFKAAAMTMHKDMDIAYSGNVDVDFVRGMIPHHKAAVEMARIMLAHGKDPKLRTLATGIIADQEKEIALMQDWLKANGK